MSTNQGYSYCDLNATVTAVRFQWQDIKLPVYVTEGKPLILPGPPAPPVPLSPKLHASAAPSNSPAPPTTEEDPLKELVAALDEFAETEQKRLDKLWWDYANKSGKFLKPFMNLKELLDRDNCSPMVVRGKVNKLIPIWLDFINREEDLRHKLDLDDFLHIRVNMRTYAEFRRDVGYKVLKYFNEHSDCYTKIPPIKTIEKMLANELEFINSLL